MHDDKLDFCVSVKDHILIFEQQPLVFHPTHHNCSTTGFFMSHPAEKSLEFRNKKKTLLFLIIS